jgi:hypothetical protein
MVFRLTPARPPACAFAIRAAKGWLLKTAAQGCEEPSWVSVAAKAEGNRDKARTSEKPGTGPGSSGKSSSICAYSFS